MSDDDAKQPIAPRPTRSRVPRPAEPHVKQLAIVAQLMMGAAHVDGEYAGIEVVAIAEQLKEFVDVERMPGLIKRSLRDFDPDNFDVEEVCKGLTFESEDDRFALLKLLMNVIGADQKLLAVEIDYLKRVAAAIGIDPDTIQITRTDGGTV